MIPGSKLGRVRMKIIFFKGITLIEKNLLKSLGVDSSKFKS